MQNTHSSQHRGPEILINAFRVTHPSAYANYAKDTYEFVLDLNMLVVECVKIVLPTKGIVKAIMNQKEPFFLDGLLFELNHVRVNPKIDNTLIIEGLSTVLHEIGVGIHEQPHTKDMKLCYKPLGEISECVRFYINEQRKMVFLCPTQGPRLAYSADMSQKKEKLKF